jgi:predicted dehydrogenase
MRFGLVGTGPWARFAHGPGLLAAEPVELVGVWGRNPAKTTALAGDLGVSAYDDYAALLADVDAVAFAVPPGVQAAMALEAAAVGKHLLLDKPVAASLEDARALATEVEAEGVASVVFFTDRFTPEAREWYAQVGRSSGWRGGWVRMLADLDAPENPFRDSPWRRERGALWDIAPHALSNLTATLGPITAVTGVAGQGDLVHLVVTHESGATSTATLSLFAPAAATGSEVAIWGEGGTTYFPERVTSAADALTIAATELVTCAESGEPHPCDVTFGTHIVTLITTAAAAMSAAAMSAVAMSGVEKAAVSGVEEALPTES